MVDLSRQTDEELISHPTRVCDSFLSRRDCNDVCSGT